MVWGSKKSVFVHAAKSGCSFGLHYLSSRVGTWNWYVLMTVTDNTEKIEHTSLCNSCW